MSAPTGTLGTTGADLTVPAPAHMLRASAGTGKTYQLVAAYVRLIARGLRPANIVAITFTRRAAAELRARIDAALRARGADAALLGELERSPPTNFHGLCLQLVRQAGVGHGGRLAAAEILGEVDADRALFFEACAAAWFGQPAPAHAAPGTAPAVADAAPGTVRRVADAAPGTARSVAGAAPGTAPTVAGAAPGTAPTVADNGPGAAWGVADAPRAVAAAVAALAADFDLDTGLPDAMWTALGQAREDGAALDMAALVGTYAPAATQAAAHGRLGALRARLLAEGAGLTGAGRAKLDLLAAAPVPQASAPVVAWAEAWTAAFGCLDRRGHLARIYAASDAAEVVAAVDAVRGEHAAAAAAPHVACLLRAAWDAYTESKHSRHVVDFADIMAEAVSLLERDGCLLAALRARIRAVLVDEAQDTNRLQRRLVQLLVGPPRHAPNMDAGAAADPAYLFVVGDAKQAIYTFRGADAQSFTELSGEVAARGGGSASLSVSRRSCAALVAGVNHLGAALMGEAYEPLAALAEPVPRPGGMVWWPATAAGPEAEAEACAACARAALARGRAPGELALLMPTMTAAPVFLAALRAAGVPAVLGGGGGLARQQEVLEVLALCRWLLDGEARLEAAVALRSPIFGLDDGTWIALLARAPDTRPGEDLLSQWRRGVQPAHPAIAAADRPVLAAWAEILPGLVAAVPRLGARAALDYLDAVATVGATYLALPGGAQRLANLRRIATLAGRHDRQHGEALAPFLAAMAAAARGGRGEPLPPVAGGGREAVTVCSMHQSKGLQWPMVLLAGLARRPRHDAASLRYHRDTGVVIRPGGARGGRSARFAAAEAAASATALAERARLLYVAVTRAESEVALVAPPPEALDRSGMAAWLAPWAPRAVADGVLTLAAPAAALPPWAPEAAPPEPRLLAAVP